MVILIRPTEVTCKEMKQQGFWNDVVKQLVGVLLPLCGRKNRGTGITKEKPAYDFAARVLHVCYPDVWPQDFNKGAELVKQRHYRTL